jgi:anti-sigma-K factor RskA
LHQLVHPNMLHAGHFSQIMLPMAEETYEAKRGRSLGWVGWLLALAFLAVTAGLAHHIASMRAELNSSQGSAAQMRVELDHANQIVAVLSSPESAHVVLTETRQPLHPVGQVSWLASKGALVFVAGGLRPLAADKAYELWLIPAQGKAPIPAGLFRPDADHGATVVLPPLPAETQAKSFEVTVEPGHGSETPSLPIVMQGQ